MELEWKRWNRGGGAGTELRLVTPGEVHPHGYIEVFENELTRNGKTTTRLVYNVHIRRHLSSDWMDCENVDYVSLRKAMRALKETVTVLIIGRGYEV